MVLGLVGASIAVVLLKSTSLGLDLRGGVELVYQGEPTPQSKVTPEAIDRSISIIRDRVDDLGVSEPEIQRSGSDQITIGMPAVEDIERAKRKVGSTAQLYFYDWQKSVVPEPKPGAPPRPINGIFAAVKKASNQKPTDADIQHATVSGPQYYLFNADRQLIAGPESSKKELYADSDGARPDGSKILEVPRGILVVEGPAPDDRPDVKVNQFFVIRDNPQLNGTEIKDPRQQFDPTSGQPVVTFGFTQKGREAFHRVTRQLAMRGMEIQIPGATPEAFFQSFAVVLDDQLITTPTIDFNQYPDGIDGRTGAEISGSFTVESAQDLADNLRVGALPIKLKAISETQVSATLGKEALRQGLIAGAIGLALVMLFLLLFYRTLGVIAVAGLFVYGIIFFALIDLIPITLTLPGIAGLILTIGVAADANIVIFERVKEELRAGRSVPVAIRTGYSKGFGTILDANVVILATAFILFVLATAGVKGFAFTLGVGTLVSVFTAVVATRSVVGTLGDLRFIKKPGILTGYRQRIAWRFDFMGKSRYFFSMSGVILLFCAVSWGAKGINPGIEFEGGGRVTAALTKPADPETVRQTIAGLGLAGAKIQRVSSRDLGNNVFQIESKDLTKAVAVKTALAKRFGIDDGGFSSESVGPTFGTQVRNTAIIAIIFSLLAIGIYIAFRFQGKFATPVMIALAHDILITFGVFSLIGREVTAATIAALLTILGYSLYDTIIVFDRVRENTPKMPGAAFSQIVNRSMSEVMTRSLATSASTLVPVIALLIFGGQTLQDFAFALIVGIVSGAYSSIFIASPVLWASKEREPTYRQRRQKILDMYGRVPAFADMATTTVAVVARPSLARKGEARRAVQAAPTSPDARRLSESHTPTSTASEPDESTRPPEGNDKAVPKSDNREDAAVEPPAKKQKRTRTARKRHGRR